MDTQSSAQSATSSAPRVQFERLSIAALPILGSIRPLWMLYVDRQGNILQANQAALLGLGASPTTIVGASYRKFLTFLSPERSHRDLAYADPVLECLVTQKSFVDIAGVITQANRDFGLSVRISVTAVVEDASASMSAILVVDPNERLPHKGLKICASL